MGGTTQPSGERPFHAASSVPHTPHPTPNAAPERQTLRWARHLLTPILTRVSRVWGGERVQLLRYGMSCVCVGVFAAYMYMLYHVARRTRFDDQNLPQVFCGRPSKFADQNLRWPGSKPVGYFLANVVQCRARAADPADRVREVLVGACRHMCMHMCCAMSICVE